MIKYFLLLAISSSAFAQKTETIFVTTETSPRAQKIFSIASPKIVKTIKAGDMQPPTAVVEFAGVMEGNLCVHDDVTLLKKYVDTKWNSEMDQNFYLYTLQTYKNGRKAGIDDGGFCATYSRHSPFRMRINYKTNVGTPARTKIWVIKFDMGGYDEKEYSPVYRLSYSQKTDKWDLKVTAR
jgi:hypothetical protein